MSCRDFTTGYCECNSNNGHQVACPLNVCHFSPYSLHHISVGCWESIGCDSQNGRGWPHADMSSLQTYRDQGSLACYLIVNMSQIYNVFRLFPHEKTAVNYHGVTAQLGYVQYNFVMDPLSWWVFFNTLRPRQNGHRFADNTFKRIFLNENVRILIQISLNFVSKGPINNNPALVQIMAWRRSGDKLLSEPMMVSLLTHICINRPQWVNSLAPDRFESYWRWVIFKLILVICGSAIPCEIALRWISLNNGPGNGLVLLGNKPLPEPMLTQ